MSSVAAPQRSALEELIDHAKTLDCIHCGLCLRDCPTYRLTGVESSGPRGRVHLMRSVAEGELEPDAAFADSMESCFLCRNCESVCPSGVHFGALMEHTRGGLDDVVPPSLSRRLARFLGFRVVLPSRFALRCVAFGMRLAARSGLAGLAARVLGRHGAALRSLPDVPPRAHRRLLPRTTPAVGARCATVAVLEGCVMPELLGDVNRATVRVLAAAGAECRTADHVCCGSLHAHNGDLDGARDLAWRTIEAFDALVGEDGAPLPVVVNSAGCGAHMKEYGALFEHDAERRARAAAFSARVLDLSELLARAPHRERLAERLAPGARVALPLAFDDPCHLCHAQRVRSQPRELLDLVPGGARVELAESESCCGSAGIYSLLRPEDSRAILATRLDAFERSGARTLVTANPGCQLQWRSGFAERGSDVEVLHLAEVLERALDSAR